MKKILFAALLFLAAASGKGYSLSVIDSSNLAQNIVSAQEAVAQTMQQVQMLQTQLNQYKRMLQDAMNPGQFA